MDKIKWWSDENIEIVEVDGRMIALDGWNGEKWTHCWEVEEILGCFAYGVKEKDLTVISIFSETGTFIRYSISGK